MECPKSIYLAEDGATSRVKSMRLKAKGELGLISRFPSDPFIIRVPFLRIFSFNKTTSPKKGK